MNLQSSARIASPLLAACTALLLTACAATTQHSTDMDAMASMPSNTLRVASYNTSLYDENAGGLIARLQLGNAQARKIAAVLQRLRPDIVLLNEFDYDASGRAADLFQRRYLDVVELRPRDLLGL